MRRSELLGWLLLATIAAVPVLAVSARFVATGEWNTTGAGATFALWILLGAAAAVRSLFAV